MVYQTKTMTLLIKPMDNTKGQSHYVKACLLTISLEQTCAYTVYTSLVFSCYKQSWWKLMDSGEWEVSVEIVWLWPSTSGLGQELGNDVLKDDNGESDDRLVVYECGDLQRHDSESVLLMCE